MDDEKRPDMGGEPFRGDLSGIDTLPALPPPASSEEGVTTLGMFGSIITAQKVIKPRNLAEIQQRMRVLASFSGGSYIYSWPVKNRKTGRTTTVEGATIKLANDLAREWGNCLLDVRVLDQQSHWMYYARFTDYETGYSYTRPYRQRKSQDTGMADRDRAEDLVFQIGASKAIRNCILNALSTLVDYTMEQARNNLLHWVDNNLDAAKAYVVKITERHAIDLERIEGIVGKKEKNWTNREYARVLTELRGIEEGLSDAEDLYPDEPPLADKVARKAAPKAKPKPPAAPKTASEISVKTGTTQKRTRRTKAQVVADALPSTSLAEQEAKARAVAAAYGHAPAEEKPKDEPEAPTAPVEPETPPPTQEPGEEVQPEPEPAEAGPAPTPEGEVPARDVF